MKKWVLAALFSSSLLMAQQGQQGRSQNREPLSIEQRTEVQVKRMTLDLDLTEKQQEEVKALLLENAQQRQEHLKSRREKLGNESNLTAEQRYQMQLAAIDQQIAMKESMKNILDEKQFERWEQNQLEQRRNLQKRWESRKPQRK